MVLIQTRRYCRCLQEISYLTSPQAMNPLPNRPLLSNQSMPLTLPNVPSLDQMAYNGRPRKLVPEVGKDFPINGMPLMAGQIPNQQSSGAQNTVLERDGRINTVSNAPMHHTIQQNGSQIGNYQQQTQVQPISQSQNLQLQTQQVNKENQDRTEGAEPQQLTAIFRPDGEWKEQLERARSERFPSQDSQRSGASAWDGMSKEDEDVEKEDVEMDDDETSSTTSDDDGKLWRPRRTLRKSV